MAQEKDEYVNQVQNILKTNQIFDAHYTHVSLVQPRGKFSLSARDALEDFWANYCSAVQKGARFGLAEVPRTYIPVVVDIDLKFSADRQPRATGQMYSDRFLKKIAGAYQRVLKDRVMFQQDDDVAHYLKCAVLQKPPYLVTKGDTSFWKNGFHLQFYNLFVDRVDQEVQIIPRVLSELEPDDLDEDILNKDDFLDRRAIGNTWLLYGSSKAENMDSYQLAAVLDMDLAEIPVMEAFGKSPLFDVFGAQIPIREDNVEFLLPRILSIIPFDRPVREIAKEACLRDLIPRLEEPERTERPRAKVLEETSLARRLVGCLSSKRAVTHHEWMSVGWTLYNVTEGSDDGLDMWIEFSLRTDDHDEGRCIYEWRRMKLGRLTIRSLMYMAKQDDEKKYLEIMSQEGGKSLNTTQKGLCDLFTECTGGNFVYSGQKWYYFDLHFWHVAEDGLNLKKRIHEDLSLVLRKIKRGLSDEEEAKADAIQSALKQLDSIHTINNIVEWCKVHYHRDDFYESLDKNRYLVGFANGIYDLQADVFRVGCPEDMIMNHMPIEYVEYQEGDEAVLDTRAFLMRIFPVERLRNWFLSYMSEIFVGYNQRKQVLFWTGEGNNGKSMTQKLFEKMMGRLSIKVPMSLITGRRPSSGQACPELARSGHGVRALWMEEPNANDAIAEGITKHLSGNDSFYTRGLYEKGGEIDPMFKMFVICNTLPPFQGGGDPATWDRVRVCPFASTFKPIEECPESFQEQLEKKIFPRDSAIDQKLELMARPLAWILLQTRRLPRVPDPPEVIEATEKYRQANDMFARFMNTFMIEDPESKVHEKLVFEYYKDFVRDETNNGQQPSRVEFTAVSNRRLGEPAGGYWKGYRLMLKTALLEGEAPKPPQEML